MAIQASKSISLTDYKTGEAFKLSENQIICFLTSYIGVVAVGEITYTDNRDNIITRIVNQSTNTILASTVRCNNFTLESGENLAINSDKIIFADDLSVNCLVTYDSKKAYPDSLILQYTAFDVSDDSGNLFPVTVAATGATRYINNLLVNAITANPDGSEIMYDAKGTENFSIIVEESPSAVQALINAL